MSNNNPNLIYFNDNLLKTLPESTKEQLKKPKKATELKQIIGKSLYEELRESKASIREIRFVAEYLTNGNNGVQAILNSGMNIKSYNAAGVMANVYLKKHKIKEIIQRFIDNWLGVKEQIFKKKILQTLYARSFYDPARIIDATGKLKWESLDHMPEELRICIEGIETKFYGKDADAVVRITKLADRNKSIEMLMKALRIGEDNDVDVNLSEETIESLASIFKDSPMLKKVNGKNGNGKRKAKEYKEME